MSSIFVGPEDISVNGSRTCSPGPYILASLYTITTLRTLIFLMVFKEITHSLFITCFSFTVNLESPGLTGKISTEYLIYLIAKSFVMISRK